MTHRIYPKIHRLGKSENEGILEHRVHVQEKIDGANLSIWLDPETSEMRVGSRKNDVTEKEDGFRGAVQYCLSHKGIEEYLRDNPTHRLFGEWLIPHTIRDYKDDCWNKFYLFDVMLEDGTMLPLVDIIDISNKYEINMPHVFAQGVIVTEEVIDKYVGESAIAPKGEGVVIKPVKPFVNKYGENVYAKVVTQEFKESNGITFGGNNKHSDTYHEMWVVNKYMTIGRVKKMMQKLRSEGVELDKSCTPRFTSQVYRDMLLEEIWELSNSGKTINFRALSRLAQQKARMMFHDQLDGLTSVAYE
jgi:hypothetical protein